MPGVWPPAEVKGRLYIDGGVWKTDDYGRTWQPIFDSQPTQSIGAIAVAPSPRRIARDDAEPCH